LPDYYEKTIISEERLIYPYSYKTYSLDVNQISRTELKEYPKCDFKKKYSRDYIVTKWTSFDEINKDSKYLFEHLTRLNEESEKDVQLLKLNKHILKNKSNFIFSGFYIKINNSKFTDKSYHFFYILDEEEKILYEFKVNP
jgi:hypothetical protein